MCISFAAIEHALHAPVPLFRGEWSMGNTLAVEVPHTPDDRAPTAPPRAATPTRAPARPRVYGAPGRRGAVVLEAVQAWAVQVEPGQEAPHTPPPQTVTPPAGLTAMV